MNGREMTRGQLFDFSLLNAVEKGVFENPFQESVLAIGNKAGGCDIESIMAKRKM